MTAHALINTSAAQLAAPATGFLQRACACGGHAGDSGKCSDCEAEERLGLQTKLVINAPGDTYEQEADSVAAQVVGGNGAASALPTIRPMVQRQGDGVASPGPGFGSEIAAAGTGAPLSPATRGMLEPRFGRDLGHVRIHDGGGPDRLARQIGARAFTHGRDIFFAAGQFDASSSDGQRLLAHEVTHTIQQGTGGNLLQREAATMALAPVPVTRLPMDSPGSPNERAAEAAAEGGVAEVAVAAPCDGGVDLPAHMAHRVVNPTGGAPLAAVSRERHEAALGSGFAHVRVHEGDEAALLTDAVDARAFVFGSHVWLGTGETASDHQLMAHELTHVAQQAPQPAGEKTEMARTSRVQATRRYYYSLPGLGKGVEGPGSRTHDYILPLLGQHKANKGLYTEVPISEGALSGAPGRADLFRTSTGTLHGVQFKGAKPQWQGLHAATLLDGAKASASDHAKAAAPAGNTTRAGEKACAGSGLPDGDGICRMDQGPATVMIGDLKPNYGAETMLGGDQVGRYIASMRTLADKTNAYPANLRHPSGSTWSLTPRAMPASEIHIPSDLESPTAAKSRKVEASLYVNDTEIKKVTEITAVRVAKEGDGIVTYEFIPVNQLGGGSAGGASSGTTIADASTKLKPVKDELKKEPAQKAVAPLRRSPARARLARKAPPKTQVKDDFRFADWRSKHFGPWGTTAKAATGGEGKAALTKPSSEAEMRMRNEARRQIHDRVKGVSLNSAPPDTKQKTRELDVVQHWIDHGEKYGRLRGFFGTTYVKVVKAYDNVKAKVQEKIDSAKKRMGRADGSSGGIKGAVLRGIRSIAGSLLGLLVRDVASKLATAVQKGATSLLGSLFAEEVEVIEEQLAAIEKKRVEFETFIRESIEEKFNTQIAEFESKFRELESIAATIRDIGTIVNIVKWAYRIAQCFAPPALGCLLALVGSGIAEAILAAIIASCWFKREIAYPLVSALDPIRRLPTLVARSIADRVRGLLPETLKPLMGEVPEDDLLSSANDVECDLHPTYDNLDPNQLRLANMLKNYDPDQVDTLLVALEKLGLIRNPPDPNDKLEGAEIDALKALLDKYSKAQLEEVIKKTPQRPPQPNANSGKYALDLEQAMQQSGQDTSKAQGGPAVDAGPEVSPEEALEEGQKVAQWLKDLRIRMAPFQGRFTPPEGGQGQTVKVLMVRTWADSTLTGATQTVAIEKVDQDGTMTVLLHGNVRYYNADGIFVNTSVEERATFKRLSPKVVGKP